MLKITYSATPSGGAFSIKINIFIEKQYYAPMRRGKILASGWFDERVTAVLLVVVVVNYGVVRVVVILTALCAGAGSLSGVEACALCAARCLIHLLGYLVERLSQLLSRGLDGGRGNEISSCSTT